MLVPIDIYAETISSPTQSVDFELNLIRNFASVFSHIATVIGGADSDYRETVADLAMIARSTGALVISHLPYSTGTATDLSIKEKPIGGPVHAWFSSCGCLAWLPHGNTEPTQAIVSRSRGSTSPLFLCSTMGSLSRYRGLSLKGGSPKKLKLGSIYLQRPGDLEIVHTVAETVFSNPEIVVEDWTTRKGVFEELPGGWTRFEVDLKADCKEPGYFLSIYGSVYMPVSEREDQRAGWLIQAHSILSQTHFFEHGWKHEDLLIAELFFVNLDWQLVPEVSAELPEKLYLFVENIPVDARGFISKPTTFWFIHPDGSTGDLPSGSSSHSEEWFSARGSGRSWETHHYDAARVLQEENGFDSLTAAAADALRFPRYEVSVLPIPDK
ncbi:hypothetical protein C8R44DRAFT_323164 [Mycena epipterygia]|nr:hypothetical protein C8R44DRAFT_323164 [Mycena epipterygia]